MERRTAARQAQQDKEAAAGIVKWERRPPRDNQPGSLRHQFKTNEDMDGQVLISPPGWRKGVNSYVKEKNLKNKHDITPDAPLRKLLQVPETDQLTYFNLQRYLNRHYIKTEKVAPVATA
jgi:hypothetical protein